MLQLWFAVNTLLWPINIHIGDNAIGLNTVVLISVGMFWIGLRRKISKLTIYTSIYLTLFMISSLVSALIGPCEDKLFKFLLSAPLMFALICIGLEIGKQASPEDWLKMRQTALWILVIAASFIVIEFIVPNLFSPDKAAYHKEGKYAGLYPEPSLAAFSLFPCVVLLLSAPYKKYHRQGVFALFFLLLFSRSSKLLMMIFCYVLYRLFFADKIKQVIRYSLVTAGIVTIAFYVNYDLLLAPTVKRIIGITQTTDQHLSSFVYVKGWQDAWENMIRTKGLGLGFNMMGCTPLPDVSLRNLLQQPGISDLNNEDGSFLFSKIVSETGLIGICFFVLVVWSWIVYERKIRKLADTDALNIASVHTTFMFSFVITSLVRSTGYFQGGGLLWVTAAVAAYSWHKCCVVKLGRKKVNLLPN